MLEDPPEPEVHEERMVRQAGTAARDVTAEREEPDTVATPEQQEPLDLQDDVEDLDRQAPPAETVAALVDPLDTLDPPEQEETMDRLALEEVLEHLEMRDYAETLAPWEAGLEVLDPAWDGPAPAGALDDKAPPSRPSMCRLFSTQSTRRPISCRTAPTTKTCRLRAGPMDSSLTQTKSDSASVISTWTPRPDQVSDSRFPQLALVSSSSKFNLLLSALRSSVRLSVTTAVSG